MDEKECNLEPANYPRRVLLLVTGLTPQVLTESLYALTQKTKPAYVPTEIHLLSTSEGAEWAELDLLHAEKGWFYRFCRDYDIDSSVFPRNNIHTIVDDKGTPVRDIRTEQDNIHAANSIARMVRKITSDPDSALHLSIAGGRKTMSFFAGYVLSLFGREQDRLSHVLVSAPYESNRDFYYPTTYSHLIYTRPPDNRPCDTRDAEVELADIPFVRLRQSLPKELLLEEHDYIDIVSGTRINPAPPSLIIDVNQGLIQAGGTELDLSPIGHAFYAWMAHRCRKELEPLRRCDFSSHYKEMLVFYPNKSDGRYEQLSRRTDVSVEDFDRRLNAVNSALKVQLGAVAGKNYQIRKWGRAEHGTNVYGLTIDPKDIVFQGERT